MPESLWGFATEAACWLYNRTPHSGLNFRTPFELFYEKKPDLSYIWIFGSRVHVLNEKIPLGAKYKSRSKTTYLVGFTSSGYRVYDPATQKVDEVVSIEVDETVLFKDDFPNLTDEKLRLELERTFKRSETPCMCSSETKIVSNSEPSSSGGGEEKIQETENTVTNLPSIETVDEINSNSDVEIIEQTIDFDWDEISVNRAKICLNNFGEYNPNVFSNHRTQKLTYLQATTGNDRQNWVPAIEKELQAMSRYDVWELVPRQKGIYAIPMKWDFTIKANGTYKARLVVVGCRDKNLAPKTETAVPTPCSGSIRWLFTIASKFGWNMYQLDFTNAFLNGAIDREKFVAIPPGIEADPKKFMFRLKKALYGLDVAPACFNREINEFLHSLNFEQNQREACIYTKWDINLVTIILRFVGDILVIGSDPVGIEKALKDLESKYEIRNLGFPKTFVGILKATNHLFLHQKT